MRISEGGWRFRRNGAIPTMKKLLLKRGKAHFKWPVVGQIVLIAQVTI